MADLIRADTTQACPSGPGGRTAHSLSVGGWAVFSGVDSLVTPLSDISTHSRSLVHTRQCEPLALPQAVTSRPFCILLSPRRLCKSSDVQTAPSSRTRKQTFWGRTWCQCCSEIPSAHEISYLPAVVIIKTVSRHCRVPGASVKLPHPTEN